MERGGNKGCIGRWMVQLFDQNAKICRRGVVEQHQMNGVKNIENTLIDLSMENEAKQRCWYS